MKSLEEALMDWVEQWLDGEYKAAYGSLYDLIREHVGATQEKLWNDLQNERAVRQALERKLEWVGQFVAVAESGNEEPSTERTARDSGRDLDPPNEG